MDYYQKIVLENVDLQGYGQSKNWIGYCERNSKFDIANMQKIIDFFLSYFCNNLEDFVIVSLLYLSDPQELIDENYIGNICSPIEKLFIEKGLIAIVPDAQYNEYEFKQYMITTTQVSADMLRDFSILLMCDEHFYNNHSHCFFVNEKAKLIIYNDYPQNTA
jgi:hypothetical protein